MSKLFNTGRFARVSIAVMNALHRFPTPLPGPRSHWLGFDYLQQAKADYLSHISALQSRYGDVVNCQVVNETIIDVHHPDLIRQLLVDNAEALVRWERAIAVFGNIHGQSVLVTEGETWKRQRRMLQPGFSGKRMQSYCALMADATAQAMASLPQRESFDIAFHTFAHQLTMDVILKTLFSRSEVAMRDRAIGAVATLSRVGMAEMFWPMSAPDWMPHKSAKRRAKRLLDDIVRTNIKLRRQRSLSNSASETDVLAMLLSVRDEAGDGAGLTDEEIRDQCMTIFLAGHETSALALAWWAWLMAQHPEAMQKAQDEIDQVLEGRGAHYDDLEQLSYVTATLKEALRMYPPAPALITRRTTREIALGEWQIPKGAMVRITPWIVHRDARWFREPLRFQPERFAPGAKLLNRNSFLPFGTGSRACIGGHFAMTEMTLIAATLLQQFSFRTDASPQPKLDVLLYPVGGLPLTLTRRECAL